MIHVGLFDAESEPSITSVSCQGHFILVMASENDLLKRALMTGEPIQKIKTEEISHPENFRTGGEQLKWVSDLIIRPRSETTTHNIIRTHSDVILAAFRLAIARGELAATDVDLVWIDSSARGHKEVVRIEIAPSGNLRSWPKGLCDAMEITLVNILRTRNDRREAVTK